MAEQEKQAGQPILSDEEKRFNRQINYFVMRYMWRVLYERNRKPEPEDTVDTIDTIYEAFHTSRERYTRIINTGVVRYAKGELDSLSQITGLRKEIFLGEVRFNCPYEVTVKDKAGKQSIEKREITEDDWKELFQWRKVRSGSKGTASPQDKICGLLRSVKRSDVENWDFYRLCYFLKEHRPAPLKVTAEQFRDIIKAIQRLSFSTLDKCEVAQLRGLQKLLQEKNRLVAGIITYKEAKAGEKKEK